MSLLSGASIWTNDNDINKKRTSTLRRTIKKQPVYTQSTSNQPNASMMAGFSPALLNLFCDQGLDALNACTPWSLLEKSLENERYTILSDRLSNEFNL